MTAPKVPFHRLPLPKSTLQGFLPELKLDDKPSAKRRSTTFDAATSGVWARVEPLWAAWPLRITKEEVIEMGVDIDQGQQVSVEDVLRRWDVDQVVGEGESSTDEGTTAAGGDGTTAEQRRSLVSSKHRLTTRPIILGVSPGALQDCLPHLDVGDASEVCNSGSSEAGHTSTPKDILADVISGRKLISIPSGDAESAGLESSYVPWSTRYVGHQFGSYAGQLGDGRAISLLETESSEGGRQEIQLKGAGRTPFSRHADGLAVLRSGVREYLGCEAVAALDIPTTRSLALLTTPDLPVIRETGAEPPSLLARLAPSFIRIGHFQALNPGEDAVRSTQIFFGGNWMKDDEQSSDKESEKGPLGGHGNLEGLGKLVRWCKDEIMGMRGESVERWMKEVVRRNAEMVAGWQVYGFCHGVLNTDNVSILGLTIDYGPYAFMDVWDENHICNHSDPSGLYSYNNQPSRILFALDKLVSAVAPLIGYEAEKGTSFRDGWSEGVTKDDVARWESKMSEAMQGWDAEYWRVERDAERQGWMKRFGLKTYRKSDDREVMSDFLSFLHAHSLDLSASFRQLSGFKLDRAAEASYLEAYAAEFVMSAMPIQRDGEVERATEALVPWLKRYAARATEQAEQDAWASSPVGNEPEDEKKYGKPVRANQSGVVQWHLNRTEGMKRVNPRFVLRQWVLEECIKEMEDALGAEFNDEGVQQARNKLAKILDMASRPFYPWAEGEDASSSEEARLCGLGSRAMLGFQCSCSS